MGRTRRNALGTLLSVSLLAGGQILPDNQEPKHPFPTGRDIDEKLPNGKSQRDEIARQNHQQSLRDADDLVEAAESLRDELKKAGNYIVSVSSVRKTEDIEKLARKIRGRLKA